MAGGLNFDRVTKNGLTSSVNKSIREYAVILEKSEGVQRFEMFLRLLLIVDEMPDVNDILKDWNDEERERLLKQTLKEIFDGWPVQRVQAAEGLFWLAAYKKGLIDEEPCLIKRH